MASLTKVDLGKDAGNQDYTVKDVAVSFNSVCAILSNDKVKCWGRGTYGILGRGDSINIGDGPGEMGDNLQPVDLGTTKKAIKVVASSDNMCVLFNDERIKCWGVYFAVGSGAGSNIGDGAGEMGDNLSYVNVGTGRKVLDIYQSGSNANSICALLDDGNVKCWGDNFYGQLGIEKTDTSWGRASNQMGDFLPVVKVK